MYTGLASQTRDYLIVQDLILLLHGRHEGVLGQVIAADGVLLVSSLGLLLESLDALRQQACQVEVMAFLFCKGRPLVEVGVVEEDGTSDGTLEGAACAEGKVAELGVLFL